MTAYERGFDAGERQAFKDRRTKVRRTRPSCTPVDGYEAGFWDGYTPRSISWLLTHEPQPFWAERESEFA